VVVIEAFLRLCHRTTENALSVKAIAQQANLLLEQKHEIVSLQPRAVGGILRDLQIPTERLGAQGRGVLLLKKIRERIHFLAMDQGIDLPTTRPGTCQLCFEADPTNGWYEAFKEMTPEQLDEIY